MCQQITIIKHSLMRVFLNHINVQSKEENFLIYSIDKIKSSHHFFKNIV